MNIQKACDVFGIADISIETKQSLKSKYRKLMKKYHPDNNNGDTEMASSVGEAYKLLVKLIGVTSSLNVQKVSTFKILNVEDLIQLYKEHKMDEVRAFDKLNTYIIITTRYLLYGRWESEVAIVRYEQYDRYHVAIDLQVNNLDGETIEIEVCGKKVSTDISTSMKNLIINIDCGVSITYTINSRVVE